MLSLVVTSVALSLDISHVFCCVGNALLVNSPLFKDATCGGCDGAWWWWRRDGVDGRLLVFFFLLLLLIGERNFCR